MSCCSLLFGDTTAAAKSLQLCPTLCDPIDGSPTGSPVPGILQARTLEWVHACAKSLQLCPTLCDPMDCSPPGSSVHGISQARILEWVATPSSRGSSRTQGLNPHFLHCRQTLYRLSHQGSPGWSLLLLLLLTRFSRVQLYATP